MDESEARAARMPVPVLERHFTLKDTALVAAIPALYLGAYALRFWHLLP